MEFVFLLLTSLSMTISRSIHRASDGIISFSFFIAEYIFIYSIVYMYHIFFIHSSVKGHLHCFLVPAVVNNAAIAQCFLTLSCAWGYNCLWGYSFGMG